LAGEEIFFVAKGFECKKKKDFQKALENYDKALELAPNDIVLLTEKANLLMDLERAEESVSIYDKILEIDPYVYPEYDKRCAEIESHVPGWAEEHTNLGSPADREYVLNCKLKALWNLKRYNQMKRVKNQIREWENSPDRINPLEILIKLRKERNGDDDNSIFVELEKKLNEILNDPERTKRKEELRLLSKNQAII